MFVNHPEIAHEMARRTTTPFKKLPRKVKVAKAWARALEKALVSAGYIVEPGAAMPMASRPAYFGSGGVDASYKDPDAGLKRKLVLMAGFPMSV